MFGGTRKLFVLATLAALTIIACNRTVKETDVVATVNDKPITLRDLDFSISKQTKGQWTRFTVAELAIARVTTLSAMIDDELLVQRANKKGLLPTEDDVNQAVSQLKQENGFTEQVYERWLAEQDKSDHEFRLELRKNMIITRLLDQLSENINPTEQEIEDFYSANKQQFGTSRGVGLAAIIINSLRTSPQNDISDGKTGVIAIDVSSKEQMIYQQLKSGTDFQSMARKNSDDPSKFNGGNIGYFSEEQLRAQGLNQALVKEFFRSMRIGDITPPVQLKGRWYIFKLTSRQLEDAAPSMDRPGLRDQIRQQVIAEKRYVLSAALIATARAEAQIVNKLAERILNSPQNLTGLRPAPNR